MYVPAVRDINKKNRAATQAVASAGIGIDQSELEIVSLSWRPASSMA
jgi:hypothetical protein